MYTESGQIWHEYGQIQAGATAASARSGLRGKGWRLRRVMLVAVLVAAALIEIHDRQSPTRPYASAPASCQVSTTARHVAPVTSIQALHAALLSYKALKACFGGPMGTFKAPFVGLASAWPESQALAALLALANSSAAPVAIRTNIAERMAALSYYWSPGGGYHPSGLWFSEGRGVVKFDDNAWLGLDLVAAYQITLQPGYLSQARAVAQFETTGWSQNPGYAFPGGIFWQNPAYGTHRNAVSTDGAALLDAELYSITGRKVYLSRAQKYLHWAVTALTLGNGLIGDQISTSGDVNHKVWSYNQGLVISVYTSLYESTKNPFYLAAAQLLAQRSLTYLSAHDRLEHQPQVFDAIYFQSLASLNAIAPDSGYIKALRNYATYLYSHTNPVTGVIHMGPLTSGSKSWLLTQAAATRVFMLYAAASSHSVSA